MDTESHDTRQRQEPRENHDLVIDATAGERDPFAATHSRLLEPNYCTDQP